MVQVSHRSFAIIFAVPLLALAACGPEGPAGQGVLRWDSAGIEIVETQRPAWSGQDAWVVEAEPTLTIGTLEGEDPYLFGEIAGAFVLRDGTIVVGDRMLLEIRLFDPNGQFIETVAGPGEGPGELAHFTRLLPCGDDKIFADERRHRRVKVWGPQGEFETEVALNEPGKNDGPYRWVCSPAGDFLIMGWGKEDPSIGRSHQPKVYSETASIWLLDSRGFPSVEFGEYPVSERLWLPVGRTGRAISAPHPLGRSTRLALGDDLAFIGTSMSLEVMVYRRTGELVRVLRGPAEDLSALSPDLERYRSADLDESAAYERSELERVGYETLGGIPAYTNLILDSEGYLWVKRFQWPWEPRSRWGVFSPDGTFFGHVVMPERLTVADIGPDYVLGMTKDDLDVGRVQLHVLRRGH